MSYNKLYDLRVKISLIGETGVGKTSILEKICNNQINESMSSTIGVDFFSIIKRINEREVKMQFWDTAGQEKFRTITKSFYRKNDLIVITFNLNEENSFEKIIYWYHQIMQNSEKEIPILILGNKSDLERKVSQKKINMTIENLKNQKTFNNIFYTDFSIYNDKDSNKLFNLLAYIFENKENNFEDIPLHDEPQKKNKCCIIS